MGIRLNPSELEVIRTFSLIRQSLCDLAFQIIHDYYLAEDTVEISLGKVMKHGYNLTDPNEVQAMLRTVVKRTALDLVRKRKKELAEPQDLIELKLPMEKRTPEDILIEKLNKKNLHKGISELPFKYHEVLVLSYFEDYTIKEIAGKLQIPMGTVQSRLNRGKKQLREILKV